MVKGENLNNAHDFNFFIICENALPAAACSCLPIVTRLKNQSVTFSYWKWTNTNIHFTYRGCRQHAYILFWVSFCVTSVFMLVQFWDLSRTVKEFVCSVENVKGITVFISWYFCWKTDEYYTCHWQNLFIDWFWCIIKVVKMLYVSLLAISVLTAMDWFWSFQLTIIINTVSVK